MVVRRGNIGDENEGGCNGEFDASVMERLGMVNVLGCFAFPEDIINYAPTAYCWETHKALEPGHVFMPLYITSWCQDLALRCFPYPVLFGPESSKLLYVLKPSKDINASSSGLPGHRYHIFLFLVLAMKLPLRNTLARLEYCITLSDWTL